LAVSLGSGLPAEKSVELLDIAEHDPDVLVRRQAIIT